MNKTLMIAATLLTLGVGSAFADGNVNAQPAQVDRAPIATQAQGSRTAFPVIATSHVSVYSRMRGAGYTQGGEQ